MRDQMIRKVWNELLSLKQRYEHLLEFEEIWQTIDRAVKARVAS